MNKISLILSDFYRTGSSSFLDENDFYEYQYQSEDMRLLNFLAEYGYLFLRNLNNIYPFAERLNILECKNLICRYENAIYLG